MGRVLLKVNRFRQKPSECGLASVTSLANFYDPNTQYEAVSAMLSEKQKKDGIYTSQQAMLLNQLGFEKVSIVTADLGLVDFSWRDLSKAALVSKLKQLKKHYSRIQNEDTDYVQSMIDWLEDDRYDNELIIDYDFPKHIKKSINVGRPVGASFNWTSLFRYRKSATRRSSGSSDISGMPDEHAVVIRGYDDKGIYIVDSHYKLYRGVRKKYHSGYYKLTWESFLVNTKGDLILV